MPSASDSNNCRRIIGFSHVDAMPLSLIFVVAIQAQGID
jgi:hypothetical protein